MLNTEEAKEILRSLAALPLEKVAEVRDFVSFLKERYGKNKAAIDLSDSWTENDLNELTAAVLKTAEDSVWNEESPDGQSR